MARGSIPGFPYLSAKEAASRAESRKVAGRARLAAANRARKRQSFEDAFGVATHLLEEQTGAAWESERAKPIAYWDERWRWRTESPNVAYEETQDFVGALEMNRITERYLADRTVSVMIKGFDPEDGRTRTLTAAPAAEWTNAAGDAKYELGQWLLSYGRGARGDEHSRVKEIVFLLRLGGTHPKWKKVTAGRAQARKEREERLRLRVIAARRGKPWQVRRIKGRWQLVRWGGKRR